MRLLAALLLLATPLAAQTRRPEPGASVIVSLVTYGPGDEVWEYFGHNAIWVRDTVTGESLSYNYGLFDFRQEHFLLHFLQGRMWYAMGGFPAEWYTAFYIKRNRSVYVQELDLAPSARAELWRFLKWNALEEHRHYFYDYYRDNCSTRIRDAIDRALGGRIRATLDIIPTGTTYRGHTQRLTADDPFIYTGLLLILGRPTDRPISASEETFLPLSLRTWVRRVTVVHADGTTGPLVTREETLFEANRPPLPAAPPDWTWRYLVVGVAIGGVLLGLARSAPRARWARRAFAWLGGIWEVAVGVAGLIVTSMWALTDHVATWQNENVLQANLLALPLAFLLPRLAHGRLAARRPALTLALMIAALSVIGLALKLLPGPTQHNPEVIALFLPAHLGVAASIWMLSAKHR